MSYTDIVIKISSLENGLTFGLGDVFLEDRRSIMQIIIKAHEEEVNKLFDKVFKENERLMRFSLKMNIPPPLGFKLAAFSIYNEKAKKEITKLLAGEHHLPESANNLLNLLLEARRWGVRFNEPDFEIPIRQLILARISELHDKITHYSLVGINELLEISEAVPVKLHKWRIQNRLFELIEADSSSWTKFNNDKPANEKQIIETLRKILTRLKINPQILD